MPLPELELVAEIRRRSRALRKAKALSASGEIIQGMGDDCAVLRGNDGDDWLVTTDLSIEGVHFRQDWHPPESVGHRCLARGLSDIAAMGARPVAAFLSLGLPPGIRQKWVERFLAGFSRLARKHKVTLAGGDTSASPQALVADVVVVGKVAHGRAILRSRARPGDGIYVTGEPGRAAAILARLQRGEKLNAARPESAAHFYPEPRIAVGLAIQKKRLARAMIDVSDGISSDLAHICEESGVGAVIWEEDLWPIASKGGRRWAARPQGKMAEQSSAASAIATMLHGGEDYELLFTSPAWARVPARIAGVAVTCIGQVVKREAQPHPMMLIDRDGKHKELKPRGWEHFRQGKKD